MQPPKTPAETYTEVVLKLARNRVLAHKVLFSHRHNSTTAPFHRVMIHDWHSRELNHCDIAFRGSAKSTIGEEAIVIMAIFREFQNCIIFGASYQLAAQRLHSIKREFEKNERLRDLFGDLRSQPWADDKIELNTGVVIQAMGRGQALRGIKEEVKRPDFIWADDIEDAESVRTPEARDKIQSWFISEAMPAMDPKGRVRVTANDMGPECLGNILKRDGSGFTVSVYPWEHLNEQGERVAIWEDRFPIPAIDQKRAQMIAVGKLPEYNMNYMCKSETPEIKPFKPDMFRIEFRSRSWENCQAMFDPARTIRATSATTGYACWSWIANRLWVWDGWAKKIMPDEIVSSIFDCYDVHHPTTIGVEEDGLNEFLMQPLRHEQTRRGEIIPVKALKAPKGKMDFIRALQPFFQAREIYFAKPLPDLQSQLAAFPSGAIDAPNALAYALKMRPGAPIYEDFSARHVSEEMSTTGGGQAWLLLSASQGVVTGILVQFIDAVVRVVADWVREGDPAAALSDIVTLARLTAGRAVTLVAPPIHWDRFNNLGLVQAAKAIPMEIRKGTPPEKGKSEITRLLRSERKGQSSLLVSADARWTLNGFAGGYARGVLKGGAIANHAEEGIYRVVMESLESWCGLLAAGFADDDRDDRHYAYTPDGRRYLSARA